MIKLMENDMTLFPRGRLSRRQFLAGTGAVAAGISFASGGQGG